MGGYTQALNAQAGTAVIPAPATALPMIVYPQSAAAIVGDAQAPFQPNSLLANPQKYPVGCTLDAIALQITGAGAASVEFGLYADNGTRAYPGALLADSGSISMAATGVKLFTLPTLMKIAAGSILWAVANFSAGAGAALFNTGPQAGIGFALTGLSADLAAVSLLLPFAFGPLPNPFPAGGAAQSGRMPIIVQRIVSIP